MYSPQLSEAEIISQAKQALAYRSYAQAQAILKQGLVFFPTSGLLWHLSGLTLFQQEQFEAAILSFERAQELGIHEPELLEAFAICLMTLKRPRAALPVLKALHRLEPARIFPQVYLAYAYEQIGLLKLALESYQEILATGPELSLQRDILPHLFNLYLLLGDKPAAIKVLQKLAKLKPEDPETLLQQMLLEESKPNNHLLITQYQRVLDFNPERQSDPGFLCQMSQLFLNIQQYEKAYSLILKVIKLAPQYTLAWLQLGILLLAEAQTQWAYRCFIRVWRCLGYVIQLDMALPMTGQKWDWKNPPLPVYLQNGLETYQALEEPDSEELSAWLKLLHSQSFQQSGSPYLVQSLQGVFECLLILERHDFVKIQLESWLEDLTKSELSLTYARACQSRSDSEKAIAILKQHLKSPSRLSALLEKALYFALCEQYDKLGQTDAAFAAAEKGHTLSGLQASNYHPTKHALEIEQIMAYFSELDWDSLPEGSVSEAPIFIVGLPRSGSTLVEQILSAHTQVQALGEIGTLAQVLGGLKQHSKLYQLEANQIREMAQNYLNAHPIEASRRYFTDKRLDNFHYLGWIQVLFPRARVIHCQRNIFDTALSCYFTNFQLIDFCENLDHIGHYFQQYLRLMRFWESSLTLKILNWAYEDLIHSPQKMIQRLLEFCELSPEPGCFSFYQRRRATGTASQAQVHQPIYQSALNRSQGYLKHLRPLEKWLKI